MNPQSEILEQCYRKYLSRTPIDGNPLDRKNEIHSSVILNFNTHSFVLIFCTYHFSVFTFSFLLLTEESILLIRWRTRFVAAVPVVERIQPSGSQWDRSTRGSAKWMSQCAQARMRWDHAEYQDCPTFEAQSRKQNDRSSCATSRRPAVNGFKRNFDKHESCMF